MGLGFWMSWMKFVLCEVGGFCALKWGLLYWLAGGIVCLMWEFAIAGLRFEFPTVGLFCCGLGFVCFLAVFTPVEFGITCVGVLVLILWVCRICVLSF